MPSFARACSIILFLLWATGFNINLLFESNLPVFNTFAGNVNVSIRILFVVGLLATTNGPSFLLYLYVVREGLAAVAMPGRFEVLGRQPLIVVDGAHNPAGADVCAEVFFDDFSPEGKRILVVGTLKGRDPEQLLSALRVDEFDAVICCTAPTARGLSANELGEVVRRMGCDEVVICDTVENACEKAINMATEEDAVLVAGSLYVVGSARTLLRRIL
jgi:folylpolyglutamate synthase/dihydropteroate synthase